MINENDYSIGSIGIPQGSFFQDNVLDIMSEIKTISGDKAGQKILNKFLNEDRYTGFSEANRLLKYGFKPNRLLSPQQSYIFRLVMPTNFIMKNGIKVVIGLNPQQEFALQSIYLKQTQVDKRLLEMKDRKLDVAQSNNKIIHLAKNLTMDFRKA